MPDILIKDGIGRTVTYEGVETIALRAPDGTMEEFRQGSSVVECTQTGYDDMEAYDSRTLYCIMEDET